MCLPIITTLWFFAAVKFTKPYSVLANSDFQLLQVHFAFLCGIRGDKHWMSSVSCIMHYDARASLYVQCKLEAFLDVWRFWKIDCRWFFYNFHEPLKWHKPMHRYLSYPKIEIGQVQNICLLVADSTDAKSGQSSGPVNQCWTHTLRREALKTKKQKKSQERNLLVYLHWDQFRCRINSWSCDDAM